MTMSTSPHPRLIGALQIPSNSSIWVRYDSGGPGTWGEIDISAAAALAGRASYYVLDDGSAQDLLLFLETLIANEVSSQGGSGDFTLTLDATGASGQGGIVIAEQTEGTGNEVVLGFTDPTGGGSTATSTWVRDWLRLATSGSTLLLEDATPVVGYRSHAFGVYPTYLAFRDLDHAIVRGSQATPDSGTPYSLRLAARTQHVLGIRLGTALPRSTTWNEYDQMTDFMDFASLGWVFRHYPKDTVSTAYAQNANPFGWREYVLDRDSWEWRPEPAYGNWYRQFKAELTMHTATSL